MIIESILAGGLILGSNSLDVSSSFAARNAGYSELNRFYQNRSVFVGSKCAISAAEIFAFEKAKRKNKVLAWVFVAAVTSVNVAVYKHNQGVLRGQ